MSVGADTLLPLFCFCQTTQAFYLPVAFPDETVCRIPRMSSGSSDTIKRAAESMSGNVRCCYCLACSMGSSYRILLFYFTGGSMGIERGLAYVSHPEHTSGRPSPACFDRFPGPVVVGISLFKTGKYMLCTICSPESQYFLVWFEDLVVCFLRKRLVENI